MIKELRISGFRGFGVERAIEFAVPNGKPGSGLTIVVGANNAGKSTIVEALHSFSEAQVNGTYFSEDKRNKASGDFVRLRLIDTDDRVLELRSANAGTSATELIRQPVSFDFNPIVVPSRRSLERHYSPDREGYNSTTGLRSDNDLRATNSDGAIATDSPLFRELLNKLMPSAPLIRQDTNASGMHFHKVYGVTGAHSSEGLGQGLLSLITLTHGFMRGPRRFMVIDEPEQALHPVVQRRLAKLLLGLSIDSQIVIATHSPFFVDFAALSNGARLARVHISDGSPSISSLSDAGIDWCSRVLRDVNQTRLLGAEAREVPFMDDRVILVEGQEDVVFYPHVLEQLGIELNGEFFGWGVGGAGNMEGCARMLHDLGFRKVAGILDSDKQEEARKLQDLFPEYRFSCIQAKDVRTKPEQAVKARVTGLLDEKRQLRPEHVAHTRALFDAMRDYLSR